MKIICKFVSMLALTIVLAWSIPASIQAGTPSVNDCLEDESNCDSLEGEEEPQRQDKQEQSEEPTVEQSSSESPNLFFNVIKLFLGLAVVLALIYFLLKLTNRKKKLVQKHSALENLGGITLGAQKSMQVVRIGQRFYVVGVGENVELLTEVTDSKTIEDLTNRETNIEFNPASLVTSVLGKKHNNRNSDKEAHKEDFSTHFKKELNTLKSGRQQSISRYLDKGDKENE